MYMNVDVPTIAWVTLFCPIGIWKAVYIPLGTVKMERTKTLKYPVISCHICHCHTPPIIPQQMESAKGRPKAARVSFSFAGG